MSINFLVTGFQNKGISIQKHETYLNINTYLAPTSKKTRFICIIKTGLFRCLHQYSLLILIMEWQNK
jgi:hypothetical protein